MSAYPALRSIHDGQLRQPYLEAAGQLVFQGANWRSAPFTYAQVAACRVRAEGVARAALRWAARDLGIAPPRLRFFVPVRDAAAFCATTFAFGKEDSVRGLAYTERAEIWIDARLPKREMVEVVGHEVKHVAQECSGGPVDGAEEIREEQEARRYGRRLARGRAARQAGATRGRRITRWQRQRRALGNGYG